MTRSALHAHLLVTRYSGDVLYRIRARKSEEKGSLEFVLNASILARCALGRQGRLKRREVGEVA